jgi:hypothetical protein
VRGRPQEDFTWSFKGQRRRLYLTSLSLGCRATSPMLRQPVEATGPRAVYVEDLDYDDEQYER